MQLATPNDDQHRHQCEVRQVLRWRVHRPREAVQNWLDGVAKVRGPVASKSLRDDCAAQWQLGNRGVHGDWR